MYSRLEPVSLPAGTTLYEPETMPDYVHFITSGVVSIVASMSDGAAAEVSIVGNEGIVEGLHLLSPPGVRTVQTRGFVQLPGTALRMRFSEVRREFLAAEPLRSLVLQFAQSQASMMGRMAACNGRHELEVRLARWLLMVKDRIDEDTLPVTHKLLAQMLGALRSSVTQAAGNLKRGGLIEYRQGQVRILDRERLEAAACECYPVARKLYSSLYK